MVRLAVHSAAIMELNLAIYRTKPNDLTLPGGNSSPTHQHRMIHGVPAVAKKCLLVTRGFLISPARSAASAALFSTTAVRIVQAIG